MQNAASVEYNDKNNKIQRQYKTKTIHDNQSIIEIHKKTIHNKDDTSQIQRQYNTNKINTIEHRDNTIYRQQWFK